MKKMIDKFGRWIFLSILFGLMFACKQPGNEHRNLTFSHNKQLVYWQFQLDVYDIGEKEGWFKPGYNRAEWTKVKVPSSWNTYDDALWGYEGNAWYATTFDSSYINNRGVVHIRFNRVNYFSKVWLNGHLIAENDDGFLPFEIDIGKFLNNKGSNVLVVKVNNKPDLKHLPAASQIEWVQYGGILQPVELIQNDSIYIRDVVVKTKIIQKSAQVNSLVTIKNYLSKAQNVLLSVNINGQNPLSRKIQVKCPAQSTIIKQIKLNVPNPELWTLKDPKLYQLNVTLTNAHGFSDQKSINFGIRSLAVNGRKILLNGKPLYLKGVNRYDILGRQGTLLDRAKIRQDLLKIKKAGVNVIRVHYPQSPLTLNLLDEIGLLLIEELPLNWWGQNWWGQKTIVQDTSILPQARRILKKMILRDKNHPCIMAWSLANECKTESKIGTFVINALINDARSLDDTRLITFTVNNEAGKHKAFKNADFVSCNIYYGNDEAFHKNLLDSLLRRPMEKTIRDQANYFPNKPLVVSEFGAAGIYGIHSDVIFSEDWQAAYIRQAWKAIRNVPECSGGILWCWRDYYHRKYFVQTYAPFGPYGVLNVHNAAKQSFYVLQELYH